MRLFLDIGQAAPGQGRLHGGIHAARGKGVGDLGQAFGLLFDGGQVAAVQQPLQALHLGVDDQAFVGIQQALAIGLQGGLHGLDQAPRIDLGLAQSAPLSVNGDGDALRALLRNLVDNAIRYTPEGGRVDVSILEESGRPVLRVCDSGRGIPPGERERVFERFYRTPGSEGVGSGLGLPIVRKIAQAHGADVSIENPPETGGAGASSRGTCVSVRFAAAAPPGPES